ncbi:MAG: hypothetical protein D6747_06000 [Chlorobiota bacterium]|jgi:hypothetical protein|nr:MAG: hypothetical protein D6747_06000 [Chlorobiota bacterium]
MPSSEILRPSAIFEYQLPPHLRGRRGGSVATSSGGDPDVIVGIAGEAINAYMLVSRAADGRYIRASSADIIPAHAIAITSAAADEQVMLRVGGSITWQSDIADGWHYLGDNGLLDSPSGPLYQIVGYSIGGRLILTIGLPIVRESD